jgi:hypothetical protein
MSKEQVLLVIFASLCSMPPGRKNIVKNGNAGNSPKVRNADVQDGQTQKALFPTGYKYPLSLLHERYLACFFVRAASGLPVV